jgi:hypothetical protein
MTAKARQAARDPFLEQADRGGELRRTGAGGRSSVSRGGAKAVLYAPRLQAGRDSRPKEEKLTPPSMFAPEKAVPLASQVIGGLVGVGLFGYYAFTTPSVALAGDLVVSATVPYVLIVYTVALIVERRTAKQVGLPEPGTSGTSSSAVCVVLLALCRALSPSRDAPDDLWNRQSTGGKRWRRRCRADSRRHGVGDSDSAGAVRSTCAAGRAISPLVAVTQSTGRR